MKGVKPGSKRGPYMRGAAMSFAEIGKALGITGGAASMLFHSGMKKLLASRSY